MLTRLKEKWVAEGEAAAWLTEGAELVLVEKKRQDQLILSYECLYCSSRERKESIEIEERKKSIG